MHKSTFLGVDINSFTNLDKFLKQIIDKKTFPDLTWTTEPIDYAKTIFRAQKDGVTVYEKFYDDDTRNIKSTILDDQGKKIVAEHGPGYITAIYQPNSTTFNYRECTYKIRFGIATEFRDYFKSQFPRIEKAIQAASSEVEFLFSPGADTVYLGLNRPLITSVEEALTVSKFMDIAKREADKIVDEFKKTHFFGDPDNKWTLTIYMHSEDEAKSKYDIDTLTKTLKERISLKEDHEVEILLDANMIHVNIYQFFINKALDYKTLLKQFRDDFFTNETAKIYDDEGNIKPIELLKKKS